MAMRDAHELQRVSFALAVPAALDLMREHLAPGCRSPGPVPNAPKYQVELRRRCCCHQHGYHVSHLPLAAAQDLLQHHHCHLHWRGVQH